MDEILSHESETVQERILSLEKKLQQQDDEIVCLKSALADALRRLATLESVQNTALPFKPKIKSTSRSGMPGGLQSPMTSPNCPPSPTSAKTSMSHSQQLPQRGLSPHHGPVKKRMSSGDSNGLLASSRPEAASSTPVSPSAFNVSRPASVSSLPSLSADTPQRSSVSRHKDVVQKDHMYNSTNGCLQFCLRGRPVSLYAPTAMMTDYQPMSVTSLPRQKLALEWVYGYRGRDARCNVHLLPTGEIIYFVAAVVVLYNVDEQMQRHYIGHTDDIKCIAVHPDRVTIATGQVAGHDKQEGKAHVRIWNSISLNTLKVIGIGLFERAVCCLTFSKLDGGQYLVAVDESNEHVMSVWDWQKSDRGQRVTEVKSSTDPVVCVEYHPCVADTIVSCGKSQISFWTFESGSLSRKFGLFDKCERPKYVTCIAFTENGDVLSGDSNGSLLVWPKGTNRISQAVAVAHDGGIFSICVVKDGTLITGGKDRRLIEWNATYQKTGRDYELSELQGGVRNITAGRGNMLVVATTHNMILQGSFELKFSPVVEGHYDEVWGLAVHPSQNQFLSVGYDKMLYLWDTLTRRAIWAKQLPDGGQCVCIHPIHAQVVVVSSVSSSRWFAVDMTSRDVIETHSDAAERVDCIQFSPDGQWLACGSRDNSIYIYAVTEFGHKFTRAAKCSGHTSFITHLDWSADSQFIQSNSGDYELLYWSAANWRQVTQSSQLRDVEWTTHNCTLSFTVCGMWPEGADGTDINACCRSHNQELLASADDFGKVNLFEYPSCQPRAAGHAFVGHSSHVTSVEFLYDDSRLLSSGGKDSAVFQWQVVDSAAVSAAGF